MFICFSIVTEDVIVLILQSRKTYNPILDATGFQYCCLSLSFILHTITIYIWKHIHTWKWILLVQMFKSLPFGFLKSDHISFNSIFRILQQIRGKTLKSFSWSSLFIFFFYSYAAMSNISHCSHLRMFSLPDLIRMSRIKNGSLFLRSSLFEISRHTSPTSNTKPKIDSLEEKKLLYFLNIWLFFFILTYISL